MRTSLFLLVLFLLPGIVYADDFQLNADGTVRDLADGLVWQGTSRFALTAEEAAGACLSNGQKSNYGWRLPTRTEVSALEKRLYSIVPGSYWATDSNGESGVYCFGDGAFFRRSQVEARSMVRCVATDPLTGVFATLDQWAASWQRLDIDGYLAAYVDGYTPQGARNHADWMEQRQQRFRSAGAIRLQIVHESGHLLSANRAEVVMQQDYRSAVYQDRVRKRLVLSLNRGRWRIEQEQQLTSLPLAGDLVSEEHRLTAGQ